MSPLCTKCILLTKSRKKERPSPTSIHSLIISLWKDLSIPVREITNQFPVLQYIKGISAFTFLRKSLYASMTVEATLVLPLFIFFVLSMGNAIEMIRLHSKLELAIWDVGNSVAIYGYMFTVEGESYDTDKSSDENKSEEQVGTSALVEIPLELLSATYACNQVEEMLGKDYLDASPLAKGAKGLNFWETEVLDDGRFEVIVTYEVSSDLGLLGARSFRMANRYYGHIWNGYEISTTSKGNQQGWVYVAENGQVFHEDRECTHLALSIREVSYVEALVELNEDGKHYAACELCGDAQYKEQVYITQSGECYHLLRDCPGLKRTIYTIQREEIEDYRPCSRCVQYGRD